MNIKRSSRIMLALSTSLAMLSCMLVQSLQPSPTVTPLPPSATRTPWPTATITPLPDLSIRIMAYNVWLGAGINPGHIERGKNLNRVEDLVSVVQQANPDILGLEELNEWDTGDPPVIEKFAQALGMQYYMAPTWRGFNLGVFSKYPILETENISSYIGNNGALRAVVQLPGGQKLNVVVAHLDPEDRVLRACQFDKLRDFMAAYRAEPSILMGDINTFPNSPDARYLTAGGWQIVQSESIDSIFVYSQQAWSAVPVCFKGRNPVPGCISDMGISDHRPVGAVLSLYGFPNPKVLPTPAPAAQAELPAEVTDVLGGVQVLSVVDNSALPACADARGLQPFLHPGQAGLMRLRISGFIAGDSKMGINLDNSTGDQPDFLRYALVGGGGSISLKPLALTAAGEGRPPDQAGRLTMSPDRWYYVLVAAGKNGAFRTLAWDALSPSLRMQVDRPSDPAWVRDSWRLFIEAVGGDVEMSQFHLLSFEEFH